MIQVIHDEIYRARKKYKCNAYYEALNYYDDLLLEEQAQVDLMRIKKGFIEVGDLYVRQFNTDGSSVWTYKASVAMHNICIKYNLFDN